MLGLDIAPGHCFIIAEAGVNHNGDLDLALRLVDAAAEAGADAVKFQTFKAERLVTADAQKAEYQKVATGGEETQLAMLQRLELTDDMHRQLQAHCAHKGILFLSTPFDEESADYLDGLGLPLFKIPSGEVTNLPFLRYLAGKGKPLIMSTGMCNLADVEQAVDTLRDAGAPELVLLHCVSQYPAPPETTNLRAMLTLSEAFDVPVGYSDHTLGTAIPIGARAMGAILIEKHFTLDRTLPGPDHQASLEPDELAEMIAGIRLVEVALGDGIKRPHACELETRDVARKSIVTARDLPAGTEITAADVRMMRPGTGLAPAKLDELLGSRTRHALESGTLLTWTDIA